VDAKTRPHLLFPDHPTINNTAMAASDADDDSTPREKKKSNKSPHRNKSINEIRERRNRKKALEAAKKKDEEAELSTLYEAPPPKTPAELREELEEVKKKMKESKEILKKQLKELEQNAKDKKQEYKESIGADIDDRVAQTRRNERHHQHIQAGAQKIMAVFREKNQGLRAIATRLPKQNKELKRTNNAYDRTTQQILMQNEALQQFCDKLQQDQEKLQIASNIHRDEYIPFFRKEIYEKQEQVDLENKIRNIYRKAMLKVCKRIVNGTKEVEMIEELTSKILEVEGQFNPSFDPSVLFVREDGTKAGDDSDSDSDGDDGDDSSSSSSSSSDSDSDDDDNDDDNDDGDDD